MEYFRDIIELGDNSRIMKYYALSQNIDEGQMIKMYENFKDETTIGWGIRENLINPVKITKKRI